MIALAASSLVLLAGFASALPQSHGPTRTTNETATLVKRGDPPSGPVQCSGAPHDIVTQAWTIAVPGDTLSNYGTGSNTLGGGLLDNLRGQCGDISNWQAASDDQNNLAVSFLTTVFCGESGVQNAIWLANGMNYDSSCWLSAFDDSADFSWMSDMNEAVAAGIESLMEAVAL